MSMLTAIAAGIGMALLTGAVAFVVVVVAYRQVRSRARGDFKAAKIYSDSLKASAKRLAGEERA